jgi:hypothetical protein
MQTLIIQAQESRFIEPAAIDAGKGTPYPMENDCRKYLAPVPLPERYQPGR